MNPGPCCPGHINTAVKLSIQGTTKLLGQQRSGISLKLPINDVTLRPATTKSAGAHRTQLNNLITEQTKLSNIIKENRCKRS